MLTVTMTKFAFVGIISLEMDFSAVKRTRVKLAAQLARLVRMANVSARQASRCLIMNVEILMNAHEAITIVIRMLTVQIITEGLAAPVKKTLRETEFPVSTKRLQLTSHFPQPAQPQLALILISIRSYLPDSAL